MSNSGEGGDQHRHPAHLEGGSAVANCQGPLTRLIRPLIWEGFINLLTISVERVPSRKHLVHIQSPFTSIIQKHIEL